MFNFDLITAPWDATAIRTAIDATEAISNGSQAPWVLGNHDVVRPVTRFGVREARAAALLQLALPGSAYIYQGEELGLPEVLDIPDEARQDPTFRRILGGASRGRDGRGSLLPGPLVAASYGLFPNGTRPPAPARPAAPWLPRCPPDGALASVAAQSSDPGVVPVHMYPGRCQDPPLPPGARDVGTGRGKRRDGGALGSWVDDAVADGPAPAGFLALPPGPRV